MGQTAPDFYQDPDGPSFMVTLTYIWKTWAKQLRHLPRRLRDAAKILTKPPKSTALRMATPSPASSCHNYAPTTFFLSITVLLNSMQVFDIINVMT